MHVKLVSLTQPLVEGLSSPEDLIVYCARVSNPKNQLNTATGSKLLKYCIDHGHWSIFEQVDMTVEIQTNIPISAQILRHKSASFQQFSARYSKVQEFEPIELRRQAENNRQSSTDIFDPIVPNHVIGNESQSKLSALIDQHFEYSKYLYELCIEHNVAKECARFLLPQAAQTTMYMKNNIRNWIHYIELRTKEDTQKEHRLIAEQIKQIFIEQFPIISEALNWE